MRIIAITGASGGVAQAIINQLPSEDYVIALGREVCADERFAVDAVIDDTFGVVFAEAGELGARLVVARVYEVGRLSAAFEREFAER